MKEYCQQQEYFSALPDRGAVRQSFGKAGKVGNREGGDQRGEACMGRSFVKTRPKPAYGWQGLDWIVGPGYSFVVSSTNKTMETNQKP